MSMEQIKSSVASVAAHFASHPEEARQQDMPATAVVEDDLRCRVEGPGGVTVITDMPAPVGGGGNAPTPGWFMRAALAACDATMIALRAAHEGIKLSRIEVTAESDSDNRGLLGVDDSVPAGPLATRTRVRLAAPNADAERLRAIVDWAVQHSPVANALERAVPKEIELEIQPPA